jgi:endonuclease/exonuclease/phosphatase family metal-dependent hydrolase
MHAFRHSDFLRVMTYNIRFDNPADGENQWVFRKDRVTALIDYHEPDLLGVQEALLNQVTDLHVALPAFTWYGAGREDGQELGEFSAIFYRKSRFNLLDKGTFWLSPTPDKPTKGWDADVIRVCSWVNLEDKETGKTFFHFNTHLDHMGRQAREECSRLLREKTTRIAAGSPALLTGDFNDPPKTPFYETLTTDGGFLDAKNVTLTPHYGPPGTWATFDALQGIGNQLDYIFVTPGVEVLRHAFLTDSYHFRHPSDHLPALAKIRL